MLLVFILSVIPSRYCEREEYVSKRRWIVYKSIWVARGLSTIVSSVAYQLDDLEHNAEKMRSRSIYMWCEGEGREAQE